MWRRGRAAAATRCWLPPTLAQLPPASWIQPLWATSSSVVRAPIDAGVSRSGRLFLAPAVLKPDQLQKACACCPHKMIAFVPLPRLPATPGAILPEGFQSQALVKLLGCGIGAGAAASLGLKQVGPSVCVRHAAGGTGCPGPCLEARCVCFSFLKDLSVRSLLLDAWQQSASASLTSDVPSTVVPPNHPTLLSCSWLMPTSRPPPPPSACNWDSWASRRVRWFGGGWVEC